MYITINNKKVLLKEAKSFKDKFLGFMGKKNIDYAIIFKNNGIHTFFMKEPIDVILTDKNYKVLYTYKNLQKNKIILPKRKVYYTIELPNNTIKKTCINEIITIHD